ncbi:MAG: hypothetical protein AAF211_01590 [Myxococcota bacterium]
MRGLVRELQRSPGDETLWLVLADALLDRGDLRGELVTLRHRLTHERLSVEQIDAIAWRIDEVEQQGRRHWHQDIADLPSAVVRWKDGFVDGLQLAWSSTAQEDLAEWLAHPSGELVTSLEFVDDREIGNDEASEVPPPAEDSFEAIADTVALRRAQSRQALIERIAPSDEQLDVIDEAYAVMNDALIDEARILLEAGRDGEPTRRDGLEFARNAIDAVLDAEDQVLDVLTDDQLDEVDPELVDPLSFLEPDLIETLTELER